MKQKEEEGITLIALIITIIILIILAAISINAIIDTRMIQTAVSGAENYVEAGETENKIMQDTADYIDSIVASIKGEDTSGGGSGTGTDLSTLSETERLALVGQYVDYEPDSGNSYTLAQSSTYTGNTNNSTAFTTDTTLGWQIWSIDDDTLTLIADDTAQSGGYYYDSSEFGWCLYLYGALGYNNGVKLLNDICETCYSSSSVNGTGVKATARSLDIVDIEEALNWDYWQPTSSFGEISSTYYYTYNMSTTYQYTSYKNYPTIWAEEDFANINGTTVKEASYSYNSNTGTITYTGSGLRRNEQIGLYETTYSTASSYIEVTMTLWTGAKGSSYYKDSKYNDLVTCDSTYWLASRYVIPSGYCAGYGIQSITNSVGVSGLDLFATNGQEYSRYRCIRPVVTIPLDSLTLDLTSNTGDTSDDAYQIVAK